MKKYSTVEEYIASFPLGVYPTPSGVDAFASDLLEYKTAKGSIQFPHDKPFPFELFTKIVKYRVQEL